MIRRRGWPAAAAAFLCACGLLLAAAISSPPAESAGPELELYDPVQRESVVVTPGSPVLHVVFFATWCPVCVEELDRLAELQARWEERGYRLVIVAVRTRHSAERLARFAAERRPPGELYHDAAGHAARALRAESLPTHLLLDAEGKEIIRAPSLEDGVVDALEEHMRGLGRQRERRP
jgi:thiol-disulfide isomerase/thioredoxin